MQVYAKIRIRMYADFHRCIPMLETCNPNPNIVDILTSNLNPIDSKYPRQLLRFKISQVGDFAG